MTTPANSRQWPSSGRSSAPQAGSGDSAGHIGATAQRRFDLAVTVRALRNLNSRTVILGQDGVNQRCVTGPAGGIDGHATGRTFIGGHWNSPLADGRREYSHAATSHPGDAKAAPVFGETHSRIPTVLNPAPANARCFWPIEFVRKPFRGLLWSTHRDGSFRTLRPCGIEPDRLG